MVQYVKVKTPEGGEIVRRRTRIFIPSTVFDNKALLENDPGYLGNLAALPEAEKKALLYGDWDSFTGQVFTEWRNDPAHYDDQRFTHVIHPFRIPAHWRIWRGYMGSFSSTSAMRSRFRWGGMQRTRKGGYTASGSYTAAPGPPTRAPR